MLYVFVEGPDDESFFSKVFFDSSTRIIPYAQMKKEKINSFIRSVKSMSDSDYLFFGDEDGKTVQVAAKDLLKKYRQLEKEKLFIVQYEIESWYYAGVCENDCSKMRLKKFEYYTDGISKEMLYAKFPSPEDRQYILAKMLECYSIGLAEDRNKSFKFFSDTRKEPAVAV